MQYLDPSWIVGPGVHFHLQHQAGARVAGAAVLACRRNKVFEHLPFVQVCQIKTTANVAEPL